MYTLTDIALVLNIATLASLPFYLKVAWDLMSKLDKNIPNGKPYSNILQQFEDEVGPWIVQQTLESEYKKLIESSEEKEESDSDSDDSDNNDSDNDEEGEVITQE